MDRGWEKEREREIVGFNHSILYQKTTKNWSKLEFHVLSLPEYLKTSSKFSNFDFEVVFWEQEDIYIYICRKSWNRKSSAPTEHVGGFLRYSAPWKPQLWRSEKWPQKTGNFQARGLIHSMWFNQVVTAIKKASFYWWLRNVKFHRNLTQIIWDKV